MLGLDMPWHERYILKSLGDGTIYSAWTTVHDTRYPKSSKPQTETNVISLDDLIA